MWPGAAFSRLIYAAKSSI